MCAVIIVRYCLKYSDNTLGKQRERYILPVLGHWFVPPLLR